MHDVMQGFYRNHMEEVIKFFETHHKVPIFLIAYYCSNFMFGGVHYFPPNSFIIDNVTLLD